MANPNTMTKKGTTEMKTEIKGEMSLDNFTFERADGGIVLSQAAGSFAPEKCKTNDGKSVPLRGWSIRTEARVSQQYGDHIAFVMLLTRPTIVADAAGNKRVQTEGTVSITMTKKLEEYQQYFEDDENVYELEIFPTTKEKLKNGHDLQHFDVKVLQCVPRKQVAANNLEAVKNLLTGGEEAKSLPTATASA